VFVNYTDIPLFGSQSNDRR